MNEYHYDCFCDECMEHFEHVGYFRPDACPCCDSEEIRVLEKSIENFFI